jgi:uncharacterized protein YfaS (alpha-2-macroglobulin family)
LNRFNTSIEERERDMTNKRFGLILLFCLFLPVSAFAADAPWVEVFSPQGIVKEVRQVTVRFSEQMVPFGDPSGLIEPFDIDCPEKGAGRWADGKNWVHDFDRNLPAGIRCTFKLKPELKALSGNGIGGQQHFSFSTGGPAIKASIPYEGEGIDEDQIFILTLDAEPCEESVLQHVTFSVEGIQDQIGIRIVEGKEKERIFKSQFRHRRPPFPPMVFAQSKQRFPADTKVTLVWGKGVMSKTGVANEKDQVLRFKTRKPFLVEFSCERENPKAGCIPITSMTIHFSAPVPKDQAGKIVMKGADGKTWKPHLEGDKEAKFLNALVFKGPFPESKAFTIEIPPGMKDDSGRPLANEDQFPLSVRTDVHPPLAKFSARFGILELKAEPTLPVTLRNLEPQVKAKMLMVDKQESPLGQVTGKILNVPPEKGGEIQAWLRKVASASRERSVLSREKGARDFKVPKPLGSRAFEVVGIPLKKPGLYVVELESAILGAALLETGKPMFVPTAVLVTNLSAHFKWGRESSLVWVTTLDTAEPAKDALVTVRDCQEKVVWKGKTNASGIARIETSLPSTQSLPQCSYEVDPNDYSQMRALHSLGGGLFVTVQTSDDMTFVHSSWDEGIEPWRFQLPEETTLDPILAHTIFGRTLLRAGETVHMKHVLRQHTTQGFSMVTQNQMPRVVSIEHFGSEEKYEFPLKWDANGIAETTWTIPKEAKLGNYTVILHERSDKKEKKTRERESREWTSGTFRVEEFRIPFLKGIIQPPGEPLINVTELTFDLSVHYLAGGAAGLLPVKLRNEIGPKSIPPFEGLDDFTFSNGAVKEGILRRGEVLESEEESTEEGMDGRKRVKLPTTELVLDSSGLIRTTIPNLPKAEVPREILTEMEFPDPNGEIQTVSSRTPLWPSRYLIGIKPDSWALSKDAFKFHVAVLDLTGNPVSGADVKVDLFEKKTYTHRKRLVGGFYAYEHSVETKRIATLCEGKTDPRGLLICEVQSPVSGNVILQAQSMDERGQKTVAHRDLWVAGKGEWWFEVGDHDRIDLIPEKRRYEPGEKATFQIRMPFRSGTALVSVEREGVMETWIKKISGKQPVVEVPIKSAYAPNVFVSVLVVRGRLPWIKPTSMVDLGKPAYKLGIAEIHVGWKSHELKINVSSDRKVYKVRQKAKVKIKVTTSDGKIPPAGSEVALAAVDEGLLELMPNRSWEILSAMMGRRGYGVQTATAQMQVIGKRHFGLKALPQGGGGGRQTTRELFDTLLLWEARLPLDANGEATAEVPLNDSITRFRIVAIATGGAGLFGTGSTSIQSTQDLMVLSGLPPLVREGDRYRAGFTVRNTTNRSMEVDFSAKAEGIVGELKPLTLPLAPGEARDAGWAATVSPGTETIKWEVEVKEKGTDELDRMRLTQRVVPVVPVSTFQATLTQLEKEYHLAIERPLEAIPGRGGVNVTFKPKIAEGLNGIIDYMRNYPYTCMEQKVSVAIALRDEKLWKEVVSQLPTCLDSEGLIKYFPSMGEGSPTLTSYVIAVAHEAGWSIPDEVKERMETGLRKYVEGSIIRYPRFVTADLNLRKLSALEALSRNGRMEAKLLSTISIEPNLWPTSAVIDWINILLNVTTLSNQKEYLKEAEQILRSRIHFQGTTMNFSTERSDRLWWLMVSTDVNAVRAVLSLIRLDRWKEDMPRLVQGALARQIRGRWDLTVANAWGVLAIEKFSKAFETDPVSGTSRATLSAQTRTVDWSGSPKGRTLSYPWPAKREELSVSHQGSGRPWVTIQSLAAVPLKEPFFSGFKIKKSILPMEQKQKDRWSKGDIVRVRLELESQADQTWVVVNDPIPAGVTLLGKGLGRDSEILTQGEERKGRAWPAFEERSFEAFRSYYEYVPKGNWMVEYTIRLNQSGIFQLPATRVEALYFPEMFGEIPNKTMEVQP